MTKLVQQPQSVLQPWVEKLSLMQQATLMAAVRGPDGIGKKHKCKMLIRWYRRCIFHAAFGGGVLDRPDTPGGGSFTGPSIGPNEAKIVIWSVGEIVDNWVKAMKPVVDDFCDSRDELPFHYWTHFLHGAEILGYKHPDRTIRCFWYTVYDRFVKAMHVWPESEAQMDARLGDDEAGWKQRSDESLNCSD